MKRKRFLDLILLTAIFLLGQSLAHGQYFGKNKPNYKDFDFKVNHTPNFEIYHYFSNDSLIQDLAAKAEKWYSYHQEILKDTIEFKNPLIFYQNHADFQHTTAISSPIGVGTGGVTEGLKNRVVMPVLHSNSQTDHVLGHEMVHAFQYDIVRNMDSVNFIQGLQNLPLWMVEGMAEYLSIGREDPNTSMWMRDALVNNDFPTIKDLNRSSKYFPYRYGQAFWAFVAGTWGDTTVVKLFKKTAVLGYEKAFEEVLGVNTENFSKFWKKAMEDHYLSYRQDTIENVLGTVLVDKENGGRINTSPSISPNGKYVIFLSEKEVISLDLYLADLNSGEILRKITSRSRDSHIDDISYIESTGTWAPDSRRYAYVVVSKGINKLIIKDIVKKATLREIAVPGVPAISNPAWSPDGKVILFTGLVEGQSDLYAYFLDSGEVAKLTDDIYSDLHPSWSPDGRYIVYATDRQNVKLNSSQSRFAHNLAILDTETMNITDLPVFPGADNFNPVWSEDQQSIYFLSDRDGFRNLYRYDLNSSKAFKLTDYFTGISGITAYSPAISTSIRDGKIVYSYYWNGGYSIYRASPGELLDVEIPVDSINRKAGTLPPVDPENIEIVSRNLKTSEPIHLPPDSVEEVEYKKKFKLDYIGNTGGVGIGIGNSQYGTTLSGGVNMLFSDILGTNQLFTALALNGEIYDFGGRVAYLNQEGRIKWGGSISHIPFRSGALGFKRDTLMIEGDSIPVDNYIVDVLRTFEDQIGAFAYLPLSKTNRLEAGGSFARYSSRLDRFNNYYVQGTPLEIGVSREKLETRPGFNLWNIYTAYVGDNSYFGLASPLDGYRYRFQLERYLGAFEFNSVLLDYRKYFFLMPVSLGFRAYHYGRYNVQSDQNLLNPLFLGSPFFIRGYNDVQLGSTNQGQGVTVNDLVGNRIFVSNFEVRMPFSGPERLSLIKSGIFYTELALFVDGGVVWNGNYSGIDPEGSLASNENIKPIFSSGLSLRLNLFGQLVIEPYYAFPFNRKDVKVGVFGVNFLPGW